MLNMITLQVRSRFLESSSYISPFPDLRGCLPSSSLFPVRMKRKTLHDFFAPQVSPQKISTCVHESSVVKDDSPAYKAQPSSTESISGLYGYSPVQVPGLELLPNFVTDDEEASLLSFLATQKWRTDLARRVIHYGGTYCLIPPRTSTPAERKKIENTILKADPLPGAFTWLIERMREKGLYTPNQTPEFCIVNEYRGDQGISAHVENFRFDEPVIALSLGDGDFMRFHELTKPDGGSVRSGKAQKAEKTGRREDFWLPGRSLLIMKGDSRWRWQHEICRGKKKWRAGRHQSEWKRTSLTFRVEKKNSI